MENFREKVAYNDGSYFLLIYDGTPIDINEDDYHEIERRLRLFMDNRDIHSDILKNIAFIRTIFVDYDERYLYIKYSDKTKVEYAEYKNKELTLYDCKVLESDKKKKGNKSSQNEFKSRNEVMNKLKDIGPIGMGPDEYKLIDCYNYFYNMNPNFSNKQTGILCQCMIQILKKFNIDILDFNDYEFNENEGILISPTLEHKVDSLFPYGMIRTKGNDKTLTEEEIEKIKTIGSIIYNSLGSIDRYQGIIRITKLLCPNEKEINNSFHNLELVKQIESKINS